MNPSRTALKLFMEIGALPIIALFTFISICTIVLLFAFDAIESKALIGFLGVIIGSGLSASTSILLAKENYRGQLAIASLEKRLQTHQDAYRIWLQISRSIHKPEVLDTALQHASEFWDSNCLYLDPASREAFLECIIRASTHRDILATKETRDKEVMDSARESWAIIAKPGTLLVKGVDLPSLGEREFELRNWNTRE